MTNTSLPMTTPAEPAPSQSEAEAEPREDALKQLIEVEIPREQERLRKITEASADRALLELSGTGFEVIKDLAEQLMEVRNWAYRYMTMLGGHMEANDDRLEMLEQFGGDTAILPEDADVIAKVIVGCQYCATALLQGPFPISERDDEGKSKLAELIALCGQAEQIVAESTVGGEGDDDQPEPEASQAGEVGGDAIG